MKSMPISKEEYIREAQKNIWLERDGVDFGDDPFMEKDYNYEISYASSPSDLLEKIGRGNWAIRQAFGYGSLLFANQINGGDEWLALKKFSNGKIIPFDSITFENMIKEGKAWSGKPIKEVITDLDKAENKEELRKAWYITKGETKGLENQEDEEEFEIEI